MHSCGAALLEQHAPQVTKPEGLAFGAAACTAVVLHCWSNTHLRSPHCRATPYSATSGCAAQAAACMRQYATHTTSSRRLRSSACRVSMSVLVW